MGKKSLVSLLILSLVLTVFLVACKPVDKDNGDLEGTDIEEEEVVPIEPTGKIIIGDTREYLEGWEPYWTNDSVDYNIHSFISGYETVAMAFDGDYLINNTVVKDHKIEENKDGSKTYTWTIRDNLFYSDGSPITAKDYVTTAILWSSKQVEDINGRASYGCYWKGYDDFNKGKVREFTGIRLLGKYEFSLTIDGANLPYFSELASVSVVPTKLSYWTDKDVDIKDDGKGAYFTDNFTFESYKEAWDIRSDYPSTGPYKVVSYDKGGKNAVLEVNDRFLGDWTGRKPRIKTVIYKKLDIKTAFEELKENNVDMILGISRGSEIDTGLDLVEEGGFKFASYPGLGYSKLQFQGDFGPGQNIEVRQAIAHLLDRNDLARSFTGSHGSIVHGPYGEGLWFYEETRSYINDRVNTYDYSLEKAKELLVEGGWDLDKDGNQYKDGIRYKKDKDGELLPLIIQWASLENSLNSDLLTEKLIDSGSATAIGMEIKQGVISLDELSSYLHSRDEYGGYLAPKYHMFNLDVRLSQIYDLNTNFIKDAELARLAREIALVEPKNKDLFKANFVDFVERWNQLLPDIPLYSNTYHDFFNEKLKDYRRNDIIRIGDSILYSYIEEELEEEE